MNHPGYIKEEVLCRGMELYEREIRPEVEPGHEGEFLAVDVLASKGGSLIGMALLHGSRLTMDVVRVP